ncbi:MAG: cation:proton antiporter [Armatimonadetes bacterium]|nr:cation:proton antiporter [Armatimonadota bacterium]
MHEMRLLVDLGVIFLVALVAGLAALRLRQPVLLAYLLGGIAVGPHGFGIVEEIDTIGVFAEVGVTLLMFALGVEFSLRQLGEVRGIATWGGLIQVLATGALGTAVGLALRLGVVEAIVLGCAVAISSTMIVMRTLMERGETGGAHGRAMLGILIFQDLAVVVILAVLPILPGMGMERLPELGLMALKAAAYLVFTLVLARTVIPRLLHAVGGSRHKELFALTIVAVCFGTAIVTLLIGFSLALGAFVAGLIISESEYRHEVFAEVIPLRDLFAILFFVSVGMLVEPRTLLTGLPVVAALTALIVLGKGAICGAVARLFGLHLRTAFLVGAGLGQTGEFSFVIARVAQDHGLISPVVYNAILSSTLLTILLTPLMFQAAPGLYHRFAGRRKVSLEEDTQAESLPELRDHVVLLGYGRVGKGLGASLMYFGIPFVAVDYNHDAVAALQKAGVPAIYGDGSNLPILHHTHPETARLAVITFPDLITTRLAARYLRRLNPEIRIIARVHEEAEVECLYKEGVEEVLQPEFEAGVELTRHALARLGIPLSEAQAQADRIRRLRYPGFASPEAERTAADMAGHVIICGYGRLGRNISREFADCGIDHVVVERDPDQVAEHLPPGVPVIRGDAASEAILERAGISRARGLLAVTATDSGNIYLTVTARKLNPKLHIVARCTRQGEEEKFRIAGADRVISPYSLGARRMAAEFLRPTVASALDRLAASAGTHLCEAHVAAGSALDGATLRHAGIRAATGVNVVAVANTHGELALPEPDRRLQPGDVIIILGDSAAIAAVQRLAGDGEHL